MASKESEEPLTASRQSSSCDLKDYDSESDTQYLLSYERDRKKYRSQQKRHWVFLAVNSFVLLLNIGVLLMMSAPKTTDVNEDQDARMIPYPRYAHEEWIEDVIEWEVQVYDDQFGNHGPFRGEPRPELDNAWDETWLSNFTLRIPKPGWRNHSTPTSVLTEWEDEEGGIMGTFSFIHNLHCIKYLRQYMLPEYYPGLQEKYKPGPGSPIPIHMDHCLDILRQSELCHADMALMTFEWRENEPDPVNIHHAPHICANKAKLAHFLEQHTTPPFGLLHNPFTGERPSWEGGI
ncbi:hypothetical protein VM1G_06740 [Cytospora mali]|uniref:Cyclochlorotine biosynthesis protein O n=1 Tax=Cytospora mali TaxID=578113 RepID=A0A194W5R5_CYTMA|nr:hypothetical protein VM1G_06740 [Valsa mali]